MEVDRESLTWDHNTITFYLGLFYKKQGVSESTAWKLQGSDGMMVDSV